MLTCGKALFAEPRHPERSEGSPLCIPKQTENAGFLVHRTSEYAFTKKAAKKP